MKMGTEVIGLKNEKLTAMWFFLSSNWLITNYQNGGRWR
jgi:hypothetical protein